MGIYTLGVCVYVDIYRYVCVCIFMTSLNEVPKLTHVCVREYIYIDLVSSLGVVTF